jgi:copper(I)-binding protein
MAGSRVSRPSLPVTLVAVLAVAAVVLVVWALTRTGSAAEVSVSEPWMAEPANPQVAGVFMQLRNDGGEPDRLVSADTDIAEIVEIHETVADDDGRTRMQPMSDGLPLPVDETVALEPGGYHVMLRDVTAPPTQGDTVTLTLSFDNADDVAIDVPVRATMDGGMDMETEGGMEMETQTGTAGATNQG